MRLGDLCAERSGKFLLRRRIFENLQISIRLPSFFTSALGRLVFQPFLAQSHRFLLVDLVATLNIVLVAQIIIAAHFLQKKRRRGLKRDGGVCTLSPEFC